MKVINISSNGIKQAIDDLVNENEMLQDKVYKLEDIIKEAREYIEQNKDKDIICWSGGDSDFETCLFEEDIDELLEILGRENNDKRGI